MILALALALDVAALPLDEKDHPLKGGETQSYRVPMEPGQALSGHVVQRGIDVVVTVRDPAGRVLLEVDSPNGTAGHEPIALVATGAGVHVLVVGAFDPRAAAGAFDLHVDAPRAATEKDRAASEALQLHVRAMATRADALRIQGEANGAEANRLYAAARTDARRALALREQAAPEDAVATHQLLGLIEDEVGDYVAGKAHFATALALLVAAHGPDDPATFTTRSDLGYLAYANGDRAEAEALFRRVIAARPGHANGRLGLAQTLRHTGRPAEAESLLRGIPETTAVRVQLGEALAAQRKFEEAETLCSGVKADASTSRLQSAWASSCLGRIRLGQGRPADAVPLFEEAARIREAAGGPDHPWTGEALADLGRALQSAGRTKEAAGVLTRARAILSRRLRPGHPLRVAADEP